MSLGESTNVLADAIGRIDFRANRRQFVPRVLVPLSWLELLLQATVIGATRAFGVSLPRISEPIK